ncbi:hypothetical protein [Amycolatopsis sp. NPDC051903]|uniref:hypothetical protein n=1 Tax=Amycolatopsis sp. NPDC051903 TaxID=3363936 RepID=UPI00378F91AE
MNMLSCGHPGPASATRRCPHLIGPGSPCHCLVFTGVASEFDLLCETCAADPAAASLEAICARCVATTHRVLQVERLIGTPQPVHRDAPIGGWWRTRACPVVPLGDRCLAPLPDGWLVLTADGLVAIPDGGDPRAVTGPIVLPDEDSPESRHHEPTPALHTSEDGERVAVVCDYGSHGVVLATRTGEVVRRLDNEDYHSEQVRFPFAFLPGHFAAATAWNRLDLFDAETGERLPLEGEDPDHFHGGLTPSPSGRWLVDDGWVWHPVGVPTVIDAAAWLAGDARAPRDPQPLADRGYVWDTPMAWLGDDLLAMQKPGPDDGETIDGVELFDPNTRESRGLFAGPDGPMWAVRNLLYVSAAGGFEVWDPADGARIAFVPGFRPAAADPRTGRFAEVRDGFLREWTR